MADVSTKPAFRTETIYHLKDAISFYIAVSLKIPIICITFPFIWAFTFRCFAIAS